MDFRLAAAISAALLSMGFAPAPPSPAPTGHGVAPLPMTSADPPAVQGYLGEAAPDTYAILPPSPQPGSPRDDADRAVFRATRAAKDTPRWALAQNDVNQFAIMKDLACAIGVEITAQNAP